IRYGLPYGSLLNPDEQSIVPRAWRMVHGGGPDPHWFDYPTLLMYVLAPFQAWQHEPSYLAARLVVAVLGVAGVGAAWWLGLRAYGRVAGAVAAAVVAVETTHVLYSHMAVTDVPLTLGVTISLALLVSGRLEWAGLAAGLATGFKYPGILLVVPLVVVGWGRWWRLAGSLVLTGAGFLAASPYLAVHPALAWHDASRVQRLARAGWLGFEHDHATPIAFLDRLWGGLGPVLIVAGAGLVVALFRRNRADLALASFALVYFLDLLTINAHFDRYVLPLVPVLGVMAGRLRSLAPVTLLLLVVPLAWSIQRVGTLKHEDTRIPAARWVASHLPAGTKVAVDSSTPPLAGLRVVPLLLPGPGRLSDPNREIGRLRAQGVQAVVITGAVEDRVLAARERYPRETRFLAELGRLRRLYRIDPGDGRSGPWVAVYHL
ncbi:MAG: glycosyltransferase 87 family protein, partial [Gaiellaceae bacterium]